MPNLIQSVVIIGTGNVAFHLGKALQAKKIQILQVLGRTPEPVRKLAAILKADFTLDFKKININADLYIIAVTDDAISEVVKQLKLDRQLVVHTAGSVPMSVFKENFKNYGVFYPLQTFTKNHQIIFDEVPVCIESNDQQNTKRLIQLARLISHNVIMMDSKKRSVLHLAAVFACNFVNHMYSIADRILENEEIDFSILHPLITETALKVTGMKPAEAQTGPAVRKNSILMEKQMKMLENNPAAREIYLILSDNIRNYSADEK
jgi:predicted short-subunit dehydrogenase-like oxidoreductase (DUF2520 family)